jgi:hypothetical protein
MALDAIRLALSNMLNGNKTVLLHANLARQLTCRLDSCRQHAEQISLVKLHASILPAYEKAPLEFAGLTS